MSHNLLFVLPDLAAGGAQPVNVHLARQLQQRGWMVQLAVLFDRPEAVSSSLLHGLVVTRLHARGTAGKLTALRRLAGMAKSADLVIGGMEFAATNYGYLVAKRAGRPFLSWTHIAFDQHQMSASAFDRRASQWVYRRCTDVVFPSAGARDALRSALGAQPAKARWHVLENFVTPARAAAVPPAAPIYAKPVVVGVGRLVEQKAFDRLIRAHAALRRQGIAHHLLLLGDGPLRGALLAQAQALGVTDSVFLPGHVTYVADWLGHATVFALCSRYEGFSLVLVEALAAGVPAVAMDCPSGPREILQDGRVGRLVPAQDESAFTQAIGELLRDPDQRAQCSALGKCRADSYTAERMVPRWEARLDDIISRAGSPHG